MDRNRPQSFRPDIEGLRGLAVFLVVAFHCGIRAFSGGFVGVDIFFVLSGYLITGLLVAEIRKTSRIDLLKFYSRRIRRLLPAATVSLFVTLLVAALIMAPLELDFASRAARATAVYLANIFFQNQATDYFSPNVQANPMLHTWSLAVEEQFYLFWPLLIMLAFRVKSTFARAALLLGVTIASLGACIWLTSEQGAFAFYSLPTRTWEFGIGGLASLLPRGTLRLPSVAWSSVGWLGILLILASGFYISTDWKFPGWIALAPVMGTTAVLIAVREKPTQAVGFMLNTPPFQAIGALSYSWYLWHWPCLVLASAVMPNLSVVGRIIVVTGALGLAAASYYTVEQPIRFHPRLVREPKLTLALGFTLTACSVVMAFLCLLLAQQLQTSPRMQTITAAMNDVAAMPRRQCVTPLDSADLKLCVFGSETSSTNILLFGDSHALQWFNAVERVAVSNRWRLTTLLRYGCPATDIWLGVASCNAWREAAFERIAQLRPTLVVLASSSAPVDDGTVSIREWQEGARRTFLAVTAAGSRVAQLRDSPRPPFDVPTCLARSARHAWYPGGKCEFSAFKNSSLAVFAAEQAAARGLPQVTFVDLTDEFCSGGICPAVQGGKIVYRDVKGHITGGFSATLAPALETQLRAALEGDRPVLGKGH
jgi:peptidoglycan/LPS O-acetylase OafA/YrhL